MTTDMNTFLLAAIMQDILHRTHVFRPSPFFKDEIRRRTRKALRLMHSFESPSKAQLRSTALTPLSGYSSYRMPNLKKAVPQIYRNRANDDCEKDDPCSYHTASSFSRNKEVFSLVDLSGKHGAAAIVWVI